MNLRALLITFLLAHVLACGRVTSESKATEDAAIARVQEQQPKGDETTPAMAKTILEH